MSKKEIVDLYTGRSKFIANKVKATPLDINDKDIKEYFYAHLMNKSLSEINAYWARLLFSGRAKPPLSLDTEKEVIDLIKRNPSAVGYIRGDQLTLTDDIKIIGYVD